ncbi:tRNA (adenosine(37)-N6)-dimethylallyltransferase, partial [Thermoleptolyngbya sp.]
MYYNTSVLNPPFPCLIVICGPTATGKSGLALNLAPRLNGVILNADSRQVYREFDIGTAKPSSQEQQQVPHYLLDICDPTQTLTVAEYQQQAAALIEASHQGGGRDGVTDCWRDGVRPPT